MVKKIVKNKKAEQIFDEKNEYLKIMFDLIPTGIMLIDAKTHTVVNVNSTVAKMIGVSKRQIIGKICYKYIRPAKKGKCPTIDLEQKNNNSEQVALKSNKKQIVVLRTATAVVINNKKYLIESFVDITERKKIEEKMKENEIKYYSLYNSSRDAIMVLKPPSWGFTAGNPATIKMFGAKNEKEFIAFGQGDVSPKKQPDGQLSHIKAGKMIEKAIKDDSNFFEWTHRKINGPDFSTNVLLTKFQIGKDILLQATVRDITKQKKAEKLFQEDGKRFKNMVETIKEQVWEVDENSVYTYMSPMSREIYGVEPKEAIGKTPFDFMSPEEAKRVKILFEDVVRSKEPFVNLQNTIRNKKNGHSFIMETSGVPFFSSDGKLLGYRGTDRDITEQIEAEKMLNEKIKELKKMNKLMVGRELKMIELKKRITKLTININQCENRRK